jgi:hypothetical protein
MVKGAQSSTGAPKTKDEKMRTDAHGDTAQGAQMDPRIQTEIGKHLRAIYDDVINEPVPSKFMELLQKLEQSTTQKS